jgi:hypothetical protein
MALVHAVATVTVATHVPPRQSLFTVQELPPLLPPAHIPGTTTHVPPEQSVSVKQEELGAFEHAKLATKKQPKLKVPDPSLTALSCTMSLS